MLDFPASPSVGQKFPQPPVAGVPVYGWDGEKWTTNGGATAVGSPPYNGIPPMDGAGASGTNINYARGDHQHPTDTSRAPLANPTFTGGVVLQGSFGTNLQLTNTALGASKYLRVDGAGAGTLQILNNAYTAVLFSVDDGGNLFAPGSAAVNGRLNIGNCPITPACSVMVHADVNENLVIRAEGGGAVGIVPLNDAASVVVPLNIYGNPLNLHGPVAFDTSPTAPTPGAGDNSTKLATTAFVLANVPTGSYLPLSGGTISGNLTVTGTIATTNGSLAVNNNSGAGTCNIFTAPGTIAQASGGSMMLQGAGGGNETFLSFHRPGAFACNFGLNASNQFGYGGWSFGAAFYKLWSTQDFAGVPVNNARLAMAGDYTHGNSNPLTEPYGGAVQTGMSGVMYNSANEIVTRYRYMQLLTTGWFTIGYA